MNKSAIFQPDKRRDPETDRLRAQILFWRACAGCLAILFAVALALWRAK